MSRIISGLNSCDCLVVPCHLLNFISSIVFAPFLKNMLTFPTWVYFLCFLLSSTDMVVYPLTVVLNTVLQQVLQSDRLSFLNHYSSSFLLLFPLPTSFYYPLPPLFPPLLPPHYLIFLGFLPYHVNIRIHLLYAKQNFPDLLNCINSIDQVDHWYFSKVRFLYLSTLLSLYAFSSLYSSSLKFTLPVIISCKLVILFLCQQLTLEHPEGRESVFLISKSNHLLLDYGKVSQASIFPLYPTTWL